MGVPWKLTCLNGSILGRTYIIMADISVYIIRACNRYLYVMIGGEDQERGEHSAGDPRTGRSSRGGHDTQELATNICLELSLLSYLSWTVISDFHIVMI